MNTIQTIQDKAKRIINEIDGGAVNAIGCLNEIRQLAEQISVIAGENQCSCSANIFGTPKDVVVSVTRIGYGFKEITVKDAISERDAVEQALDLAPSLEFSEKCAEYESEDVRLLE